MQHSTFKENW